MQLFSWLVSSLSELSAVPGKSAGIHGGSSAASVVRIPVLRTDHGTGDRSVDKHIPFQIKMNPAGDNIFIRSALGFDRFHPVPHSFAGAEAHEQRDADDDAGAEFRRDAAPALIADIHRIPVARESSCSQPLI